MVQSQPREYTGKEGTVKFADVITNVSSSTPLGQQISNSVDLSGDIKDITITDPEAGVEVEDTFGAQIKAESPADLVTVDFTFRFRDLEAFQRMHDDDTADTFTASSTTWTRVSGGPDIGSRRDSSILFKLKKTIDGTDYIMNYLLNNAIFSQTGDLSLDADGNAELSATATALIEDRYVEQSF